MLGRDAVIYADEQDAKGLFYMDRAIAYIRMHYAEGIGFLSRFRISRAKELLTVSEMSVENVALSFLKHLRNKSA